MRYHWMTPDNVNGSAAAINSRKNTQKKVMAHVGFLMLALFVFPHCGPAVLMPLKRHARSNSVHGRIQYQPSICHAKGRKSWEGIQVKRWSVRCQRWLVQVGVTVTLCPSSLSRLDMINLAVELDIWWYNDVKWWRISRKALARYTLGILRTGNRLQEKPFKYVASGMRILAMAQQSCN